MRRCTVALGVLVGLGSPAAAQWPPDSLVNLQVLPDTTPVREVTRLMAGFTRALGVRCSTCHMGEEGQPLAEYDFASDERLAKRKAREMMRMVAAINGQHLAGLEERASPPVTVTCFTCHHGVRQPRTLQEEVLLAYDAGGLPSASARYDSLQRRYQGRAAYDFGEVALADVAGELAERGAPADAAAVHALNTDQHPESWFAWWARAEQQAAMADTTGAIASLERALALNPDNRRAAAMLRGLRGGPGSSP